MERAHLAAGATLAEPSTAGGSRRTRPADAEAAATATDVSHLGKLDVRGPAAELDALTGGLGPGAARADDDVWTLRLTPTHGYVLCPFGARGRRCASASARPRSTSPARYAAVALGGERRTRRLQPLVRPRRARVALRRRPLHGRLGDAGADARPEPRRRPGDARRLGVRRVLLGRHPRRRRDARDRPHERRRRRGAAGGRRRDRPPAQAPLLPLAPAAGELRRRRDRRRRPRHGHRLLPGQGSRHEERRRDRAELHRRRAHRGATRRSSARTT